MNRNVYSVFQLNQYIKSVLEDDLLLSGIFIEGEISNFKHHSSGHMYFTLKDAYASVNCVMFRTYAASVGFTPENGMRAVVFGRVSVYEKTGQYQVYAEDMEPWGKGSLYLAFEQLKAQLMREGLFAPEHKRALPPYPESIAVITSPTGAAVRDIINIARRRNRKVGLNIIPSLVQGASAAESIISSLALANEHGHDIIILARGGGSIEDLWPFNDESLARAVYASETPVVSAVGHETDYCITDFVADLRAPTPSAAAELCVPELAAMEYTLTNTRARLEQIMTRRLETARAALKAQGDRVSSRAFLESVYNRQIYLEQLFAKLTRDMAHKTEITRLKLAKLRDGIELVSPEAVLKRGYALAYGDGGVKTSAGMLAPGEHIRLRFHDGEADMTVTNIQGRTYG